MRPESFRSATAFQSAQSSSAKAASFSPTASSDQQPALRCGDQLWPILMPHYRRGGVYRARRGAAGGSSPVSFAPATSATRHAGRRDRTDRWHGDSRAGRFKGSACPAHAGVAGSLGQELGWVSRGRRRSGRRGRWVFARSSRLAGVGRGASRVPACTGGDAGRAARVCHNYTCQRGGRAAARHARLGGANRRADNPPASPLNLGVGLASRCRATQRA
jgi:hypothetical protein